MSGQFRPIEEAHQRIAALVEKYAQNREHYRHTSYNEETARSEFISPFFEALGWDVANRQALAPAYKDVIHEESLRSGEYGTKAPDYTFRVGGQRKFFVEAKKPFVDVKNDPGPANQLRRYAWTAKLPVSILTDFEELAVYDTRRRPGPNDKASVARIQLLHFEEYLPKLELVWNVFSKEAVYKGSFDRYAEEALGKRGTSEVDAEFLKELESWRDMLAKNIALRNTDRELSVDELNFAVQATIDRILFLRIAEGRGVEEYAQLQALTNGEHVYARLMQLFKKADTKYNSGIFDFKSDQLTPKLEVDDKVVRTILASLYYPLSPYEFSVLPPEILGNVYEQFLGKVIRLTAGGHAKVEAKPEVKKAGGVYYTPTYIVDYIVKHTVGKLCERKSPKEMAKLRIVDPACGSGSFLLVAFQTLMDAHLAWYRENNPKKHTKEVFLAPGQDDNNYRLTTTEKRRILLHSIYGVDIDRQAVEVTKLSLLLRVLEGENAETLKQHALFGERALPSLEANIKCGNSLLSFRDLPGQGSLYSDDEGSSRRINPFSWEAAFPEVFKAGGFDTVIGNPPYIRIQTMKKWAAQEVEIYKSLYKSAASGNYDVYAVFVEKGLQLLNKSGRLGFIVPHKFFNAKYGEALRNLISEGGHLAEIVHFGDQQVFSGATTYTCLLFLDRLGPRSVRFSKVADLAAWRSSGKADIAPISSAAVSRAEWNFAAGEGAALMRRLSRLPLRLGDVADIFVGVQTSADEVFILDFVGETNTELRLLSRSLNREVRLEKGLMKPIVSGVDVKRFAPLPSRQYILFPYKVAQERATLLAFSEIARAYPQVAQYLRDNRDRLQDRERGKFRDDEWYRFGRSQNLGIQGRRKLCIPRLVTDLAATIDDDGSRFLDNVDVGGLSVKAAFAHLDLWWLLALLNSRLLRFYFPSVSAPFRGGFRSANRQFLSQLPVVNSAHAVRPGGETHDPLTTLARRARDLQEHWILAKTAHDRDLLSRQIEVTDREIDRLVYELYDLTPEEIAIVEKATERK